MRGIIHCDYDNISIIIFQLEKMNPLEKGKKDDYVLQKRTNCIKIRYYTDVHAVHAAKIVNEKKPMKLIVT